MKKVYIVVYQEDKYGSSSNIAAFDTYKKAKNYIKSIESMPDEIEDENGDFWANDSKFDSEYLWIDSVELKGT